MCCPTPSAIVNEVRPDDHRCLIVDDSPTFCAALRRMLEAAGMTVVATATTLADAVEAAQVHHPDLALVDVYLGGESGFDVVEAIHGEPLHPRPDVILVSTHDVEDFVDLVEASSAVAFLPKFGLSAETITAALAGSR